MSKSNAWIVDGMISGEGWKVLYVLNVRLIYIYIYLYILYKYMLPKVFEHPDGEVLINLRGKKT